MTKKTNNLNVFKTGYLPFNWYPKNWIYNIKIFFRNFKYAYQRATKGYCDRDLWNLDYYYSNLLHASLLHFADATICYPAFDFKEFEDWVNYLKEMASHFENIIDDDSNEFAVQAQEMLDKVYSEKDQDKIEEYRARWLALEKQSSNFLTIEKDLAFDMLKKYFFNLWD